MKRQLNDTDLARFSVMAPDQRHKALEGYKFTFAPYSLKVVRKKFLELLNFQGDLFASLGTPPRTDFDKICDSIARTCRDDDEAIQNLEVAELLGGYWSEATSVAREIPSKFIQFGAGKALRCWVQAYGVEDGRPTIYSVDPRGSKGLNASSRRFTFSVIHEGVRAADPDFEEAQIKILQLSRDGKKKRKLHVYTDEGVELFSYARLDEMIRSTYADWYQVQEEREEEIRAAATGAKGSLL